MAMTSSVRGRARRRWLGVALVILFVAAGLVAALPWLLGLPAAQRRLAAMANAILAPSSVEFGTLKLSWFRPTEISNVVLHDAQGDRLLTAPRATFGWNLWQTLVTRPKVATLSIRQGDLDIERFADGRVDLYETLKPVISEHPPIRLLINIENGRLRYRDPLFSDPVVADEAHFRLNLGRGYEPITWDIQLARTQAKTEPSRLSLKGNYSRADIDPAGRHDLTIAIEGSRWPWTLANSLIQARGGLTGKVDGQMRMGRARLAADASVTDLIAIGDLLSSDTVHLDTMRAGLSLEVGDDAWTIERLDVTSPVASVRGQGAIPPKPQNGAWLEANVDLAAVAKQLAATIHLRDDLRVERGQARLRTDIKLAADGKTQDWNVSGTVSNLVARQGEKLLTVPDPATLVAKLQRNQTAMTLEKLDVQSSFLTATGHGDLDHGIVVDATLDLAAFRDRFRDWIDLGKVDLAGQGTINARYQRRGADYQTRASMAFRNLRVGGLPLVEQIARDQLTLDCKVEGPATPSGWPQWWRDLSLRAASDQTDLQMQARLDNATGEIALEGRGSSRFVLDRRQHRVEGELRARSSQRAWTAERLALVVFRDSKWGAGIAPDLTIRWEGSGRYDPLRDQLVVESSANRPRQENKGETWIYGDQRLHVSGLKSATGARIELAAKTDLSALGRALAPDGGPWSGALDSLVEARRDGELWNLGARLDVRDPQRTAGDGSRTGLAGRTTLSLNGSYAPGADRLQLSELVVKAPHVLIEGTGAVRALTSRAQIDLKGTLSPDWNALSALLSRNIEPNARIEGRPRTWRLAGTVDGLPAIDRMGSLEGEIGTQIDSLDVFGMRLSSVPVVLRSAGGRLRVDPIDARLNSGILHLEPELIQGRDGSTWLHLGPASRLDGAVVNDEVSHRVLSFAAPVLDGATRVRGRVSLALADALFPVIAPAGEEARAEGEILFDDFRFMPGPLANELLTVFQLERRPLAVLRDPIAVRIAGRKVYQEGLTIPVANLASIGLDGSVDFDKNLDMVAHFALIPPRSNVPVLTPILERARFDLPIRGTLRNPKIDGEALKEHWKSVGADLLGNSLEAGVNGLQKLLQGLRIPKLRGMTPPGRQADPPLPPEPATPGSAQERDQEARGGAATDHDVLKPTGKTVARPAAPSPEERRQKREERRRERLQKKAERRQKQGLPPR
jgi:translocation and assembly module TamB